MATKLKTFAAVTCSSSGVVYPISSLGIACTSITIQAFSTNIGEIYVGDLSVSVADGIGISPGDTCEIAGDATRGLTEEFYVSEVGLITATGGNGAKIIGFVRRV